MVIEGNYTIIVFVLIVIVFTGIDYIGSLKRSENRKKVAINLGFKFSRKVSQDIKNTVSEFELYTGNRKKIFDVMCGERRDVSILFFNFQHYLGERKNLYCVVAFKDDYSTLPDFQLLPDNLVDKIDKALSRIRNNFGDFPIFYKLYSLFPHNEEKFKRIFGDAVLSHLDVNKNISIECKNNVLIFYVNSELSELDEIDRLIENSDKIRTLLTEYVN